MKLQWNPQLYYDSASDAALISGSAQLASSAVNAMSVSGSSKKDREFMKEMHDKQRAEAIADRDYANQYNLPSNEMARLKAAGLNPNLIYGKAGGDMASSPVRSSDFTPYHRQAPTIDIGGAVGSYFQIQSQQSQLANMAMQRQVMDAQTQEIKARANYYEKLAPQAEAKTGNIIADTNLKTFSLDLQQQTRDITVALKQQGLDKMVASTQFTLDENQRQAAMNAVNVQQGLANVLKIDAQTALTYADKQKAEAMIKMIQSSTELKNLDIDYIKNTGNTGRPGESPIAKLVELIYGKLVQKATPNTNPKANLPPNINGYILPNPNE